MRPSTPHRLAAVGPALTAVAAALLAVGVLIGDLESFRAIFAPPAEPPLVVDYDLRGTILVLTVALLVLVALTVWATVAEWRKGLYPATRAALVVPAAALAGTLVVYGDMLEGACFAAAALAGLFTLFA